MNYVDRMVIAVQKAGTLVMAHFRSDMKVHQKQDGGIVTEVDVACELLLKQELSAIIPGASFFAEESGVQQGNEYTWVIDPIDGTKNFERGLPYFCISIALMYHEEIVAAVTYAPALQDLFYAQRGRGAWLNGKQLKLSQKNWRDLGILVVVSGGCVRSDIQLDNIRSSCQSISKNVGFRVNGAAALDLAYVAAGMFDVAIFENLKWWDAAAGILLVGEAGGWVTVSYESLMSSLGRNVLAGNNVICRLILPNLADKKEYV